MTEDGMRVRLTDGAYGVVVRIVGDALYRVSVDDGTVRDVATVTVVAPEDVALDWAHEYAQYSRAYVASIDLVTMSAATLGLTGERYIVTAPDVMAQVVATVAWLGLRDRAAYIADLHGLDGATRDAFMAEHAPTAYDAQNMMTVDWCATYSAARERRADALAYMSNLLDANDDDNSQDRADACTIIESLIGRSL